MGSIKPACLENYSVTKEYHAKRINIKRITLGEIRETYSVVSL